MTKSSDVGYWMDGLTVFGVVGGKDTGLGFVCFVIEQ